MIDKETYGIEAEVETSKAKKSLKDLANFIRNFGKQVKDEATITTVIDPKISKDELLKWRKDLEKSISDVKKDINVFGNTPTGKFYNEDLKRYEDGLKLVNDRIQEIEESEEEANSELEETNEQASKTTSVLSSLFDKSIGKIKRFTYYLLGARSVFSLFMKYQSIYYQYNEQMQYQSELSQNAIALSLAPAFEFLGNVITYTSIAFAKFIELLTGVPILSKVSTKGIRDYNKALKESQTLVSGIDEITNLSLPSSTGLATQYKALDDFQKKVAEVEKFFKENKWIEDFAKGLKKIFDWISDTYNYIHDHWDFFKYIFGGVAIGAVMIKLGMSLSGVATVLGATSVAGVASGTGLLGLVGIMKYLIGIGSIVIGISILVTEGKKLLDLIDELKEVNKQKKDIENWNFNELQKMPSLFDTIIGRLKDATKGSEDWYKETYQIKDSIKTTLGLITTGKVKYEEYYPVIKTIREKLQEINDGTYNAEIDLLMDIEKGKKSYDEFIAYIRTGAANVKLGTDGGGNKAGGGGGFVGGGSRGTTTTTTKTETKQGTSILTTVTNALKKGLSIIGLATGTNYVPYDNYPALLHKGEAVVPAKYNPAVSNVGNEYTNSLLEEVVIKLDDLAKRPNVFEIDGQKFASATYGLYDDERKKQNYVEGVVR